MGFRPSIPDMSERAPLITFTTSKEESYKDYASSLRDIMFGELHIWSLLYFSMIFVDSDQSCIAV